MDKLLEDINNLVEGDVLQRKQIIESFIKNRTKKLLEVLTYITSELKFREGLLAKGATNIPPVDISGINITDMDIEEELIRLNTAYHRLKKYVEAK